MQLTMGDFSQEIFSRTGPERVPPVQLPRHEASISLLPGGLQPLISPAPSMRSSNSEQASTASWASQVTPSIRSRTSRASSIVSTRTRASINTFQEDTRSVDIQLGGRTFHIHHDGSKISERLDDLPPYSPPTRNYTDTGVNTEDIEQETASRLGGSVSTLIPQLEGGFQGHVDTEISTPTSLRERTLSGDGIEESKSLRQGGDSGVSRNLSFTPGKDKIQVERRRTLSQSTAPPKTSRGFSDTAAAQLKRRNGLRLPKIVTGLPSLWTNSALTPGSGSADGHSPSSHLSRSAGPTFAGEDIIKPPSSPTFIGRGATGLFPSLSKSNSKAKSAGRPPMSQSVPSLLVPESPVHVEEEFLETSVPLPMDSPNDISIHYTRLIRSLDHSHRRALHDRDMELSHMRERLNSMDLAYRKELRKRDGIIDDLSERVNALESTTELENERLEEAIEKAKHEVENVWEKRWKIQGQQLVDEFRRREDELNERLKIAEETNTILEDKDHEDATTGVNV